MLSALEPEDLELLYESENDCASWQDGAQTVPISHYAIKQYIAEARYDLQQDGQVRFAVKSEGMTVGFADLTSVDLLNSKAEVGIYILSDYRGKGYALKALEEMRLYAAERGLHMLYATVRTKNEAAKNLFLAARYSCVATLPQWVRTTNGFEDCLLFCSVISNQ